METLRRNSTKSSPAYQKFAVISTEKQKRVYEKIIQKLKGKDQGKLGRQSYKAWVGYRWFSFLQRQVYVLGSMVRYHEDELMKS